MQKETKSNITDRNDSVLDSNEDAAQFYNTSIDDSSDISPESEVDALVEVYNWILTAEESGCPIVEAKGHKLPMLQYMDGTQNLKELSELTNRLMQLVPSLKTMETDDKEIDDFISDVKMSGISKITDRIKRYQKNIEQHQDIDWGEAEMSDGVEVDDWD